MKTPLKDIISGSDLKFIFNFVLFPIRNLFSRDCEFKSGLVSHERKTYLIANKCLINLAGAGWQRKMLWPTFR